MADIQYFLRQPIKCLAIASKLNVSMIPLPNFLLEYICRVLQKKKNPPQDLFAKYTTIYVGAEPIRMQTVERVIRTFTPLGLNSSALYFCYGMAESTLIISGYRFKTLDSSFDNHYLQKSIACVGKSVDKTEVKIIFDNPEDKIGNIYIRGESLFKGYQKQIDYKQKWFNTGDIGYCFNGNLYVVGRSCDSTVINGRNLYALDIENMYLENFEIKNCFIAMDQEKIYLFIVPKSNKIDKANFSSFLVNKFGVSPTEIYCLPQGEIPMTTSGKPMKYKILNNLENFNKWRISK